LNKWIAISFAYVMHRLVKLIRKHVLLDVIVVIHWILVPWSWPQPKINN